MTEAMNDGGRDEEEQIEAFEKDVSEIERTQLTGDLSGFQLGLAVNDPGDGLRCAVQLSREESGTVVWESDYYNGGEFGAFLEGMRASGAMRRKAEHESEF
jgi:hypothetical protein